MVASVTNLGRSGLYDWVIQRLSAVVLALYTLFLVGFLAGSSDLGASCKAGTSRQRTIGR